MPLLSFFKGKDVIEVGVDEAGRGCLCGDVFAAAVIFPSTFICPLLNDSKMLGEKQRLHLRRVIEENALSWGIGRASVQEIDEINILNAAILAMHRAIDALVVRPDYIIVDGNRFKSYQDIPHQTVIKGDAKYQSIAAASILAKTYRDDYMVEQSMLYPYYGMEKHKGYPTKQHRDAIRKNGVTSIHRLSFKLLK